MQYLLLSAVVAIAFMIVRGNVRGGSKSTRLGTLLRIALLCGILVAFVAFGWKSGILAIVVAYGTLAVSRSILRPGNFLRVDAITNAMPRNPNQPDQALELLSRQIAELGTRAQSQSFDEFVGSVGKNESDPYDVLITRTLRSVDLRDLLQEYSVDHEALQSVVRNLRMHGAGQWRGGHFVVASAISYPETLRFLLEGRLRGVDSAAQTVTLLAYFESGQPLTTFG